MVFQKTTFNLKTSIILFLSILSIFTYQGCRKDILLNSQKANTFVSITEIKDSYEKLAIDSRTCDSLRSGLIIKYIPQWENAKYSQINDSTQYTIIPLIESGQLNEKEISIQAVNNTPFLVVANGEKFYLSRFYPDKKSDDNFLKNGKLSMIDILNKNLFTYSYENSKSTYNAPKALKSPKGSTKKAAYEVRCREEGTCVWSTYCHGVGYISTSFPGTCNYPTDYTECDYSVSWSQDRMIYNTVCENVWVPDPPTDGGTTNPETPPTPKQLLLQQTKNTDCDGVTRANQITSNQAVRNVINTIKDKDVEWGAAIKLSNPNDPSSLIIGTPSSDNNVSRKSVNPTWDSKGGYVIGYIHNHPNGGAPSPSDIFNAALDLTQMVDQQNIPANQLESYIRNYTSIIVSGGNVYTLTIENAQLFAIMAGNFNKTQKGANEQYTNSMTKYFVANEISDPPSTVDNQTSGELALLKMYGKMFNLNKQKIDETNKNQAVNRDSKGKLNKTNPCTL